MKQLLELLAPAGNAEIGIAAIDHGADAVYVGAPKFSARAGAGVDAREIARLIRHAHFYSARVYVALNTILMDDELEEARHIIDQIHDLGADGLIIQDLGLLEMNLPPIPLIASTQMHNDTPEKVRFLEDVGFNRVILARELSLEEISAIRSVTRIELEQFVHGALCVSYSGQCYMSEAATGRSGNRGVCAQPCRLPYTLEDGDGRPVITDKFLLSLKDLNLMNNIPDLVAAGITSFKIEGRYKEIDYVKNVTAAYSRMLDAFIRDCPGYGRRSSGESAVAFSPDPARTFNRGFTRYFIYGRNEKTSSLDTPKAIGAQAGTVTGLGKGYFRTDCTDLKNGDGLCFFTKNGKLVGFRVDRVDGPRIVPNTMRDLSKGVLLYRNHDAGLTRQLKKSSARRQIRVEMDFRCEGSTVCLQALDEDGNCAEWVANAPFEKARDPIKAHVYIEKQLRSTGSTPFKVIKICIAGANCLFSLSFLNGIRRNVLTELAKLRIEKYHRETASHVPNAVPYPANRLDFHANVYNKLARRFYERHGAEVVEPAFEALSEITGREVMRMKYCLLYELDACPRFGPSRRDLKGPLRISDREHAYQARFDCQACIMSLIYLGRK